MTGDLTQQQVTGIVHPTNSCLSAGGRTSRNSAKAAGPTFEQDCKDALACLSSTERAALEGSCVVMPCKNIFAIAACDSRCWTLLQRPGHSGRLASNSVLPCSPVCAGQQLSKCLLSSACHMPEHASYVSHHKIRVVAVAQMIASQSAHNITFKLSYFSCRFC